MTISSIISKSLISTLFLSSLCMANENADNEQNEKYRVSPSLIAGLTYGGDDLGYLEFEGGDQEEVTAGGLIYLGGGFNFPISDSQFSIQTNFAYHFDTVNAKNGDITFDRFSAELIPFYQINENHRIGLGLLKPLSAELEVDFNGKDTVELDASTGLLLEWGYSFNEHSTIAIRYASVDYEISGTRNSDKIDGNYIGAMFYWYFGQ